MALLIVSNLPASAQGVIHLGQGDSYLFVQPTFIRGQIDDGGAMFIRINLGFTGDLFTMGDRLQVDILSTPTSLLPLLTNTVSNPPWTNENGIGNVWTGQIWNASDGAVRLTVLVGSVDVSSVAAITAYQFTERFYSYTIPEPNSSLLFLFSGAALGGMRWINRRKKRKG